MSSIVLILLVCLVGTASASRQFPFVNRPFAWSGPPVTPQPPRYSSVVVFGGSYADNAHPRAAAYNFSFRGPPYYDGRYSNGIVFDEYTAASLNATLINYAYGGASANNSLTLGYVPSTRDQVNQYISDIASNSIDRGNGSVLHIWWVGMNPMREIVSTALYYGALSGNLTAYNEALSRVKKEIVEVTDQVKTVRESSVVKTLPTHIILLPIPAIELIPDVHSFAVLYSNGTTASIDANSNFITMLNDYYNLGLMTFVARDGHARRHPGCLRTFNVPLFWRELYSFPAKYNYTETVKPCYDYNSAVRTVCSNPANYIQWDPVNPTTRVHGQVGEECAKLAIECL